MSRLNQKGKYSRVRPFSGVTIYVITGANDFMLHKHADDMNVPILKYFVTQMRMENGEAFVGYYASEQHLLSIPGFESIHLVDGTKLWIEIFLV